MYSPTRDPRIRALPWATRWLWIACLTLAKKHGGSVAQDGMVPWLVDEADLPERWVTGGIGQLLACGALTLTAGAYRVVTSGGEGGTYGGGSGGNNLPVVSPLRKREDLPTTQSLSPARQGRNSVGNTEKPAPVGKTRAPSGRLVLNTDHHRMTEAVGSMFNAQAPAEWQTMAKVAADLLKCRPPVAVDELPALGEAYGRLFPGASMTATALAKYVGQLRAGIGQPNARNGSDKRLESSQEQMERILREGQP